jgi:hypothetical protein
MRVSVAIILVRKIGPIASRKRDLPDFIAGDIESAMTQVSSR